jgi:hypothetical protein
LNAAISTITPAKSKTEFKKESTAPFLTSKVIEYRNREDSRNGINLIQLARLRKESALLAITQNKRYIAGLQVVAGCFKLGMEALDDITRRKEDLGRMRLRKQIRKLCIIQQH